MKPENLVRQFLLRRQELQSGYSLRALARDLKASPSFLSEVMSGKKKMPVKWIARIAKILSLDEVAVSDLKVAVLQSHLKGSDLESLLDFKNQKTLSKVHVSKPLDRKKMSVLSKWYYVAILDFLTIDGGPFNEEEIAERMDLSKAAVREALTVLEQLGLVTYNEANELQKTDKHIRFPTVKTDPTVRNFHVQMIEKAKYELIRKTEDQDFARRLITGVTMAVDPRQTEKIKRKLQELMAELSQEFSEGDVTELYQLNIQLFPLTKEKK